MQPQSTNSQFDFMLKDNQPAKKGMGGMPKLSKPIMIGLAVILGVIIIIIISSILSGRKNGATQPIIDSAARGQEIIRVTKAVQTLGLQDPSINATSMTVLAVLTSDNQQMVKYLATIKVKVTKIQLAAYTDESVDTQMQSARQGNNLDQAYIDYLRQYLSRYQTDLQKAYKTAPGPNGRELLKKAFDSETALLNNAPLKS